jgi:hypothetical protein
MNPTMVNAAAHFGQVKRTVRPPLDLFDISFSPFAQDVSDDDYTYDGIKQLARSP